MELTELLGKAEKARIWHILEDNHYYTKIAHHFNIMIGRKGSIFPKYSIFWTDHAQVPTDFGEKNDLYEFIRAPSKEGIKHIYSKVHFAATQTKIKVKR